MRNRIAGFGQIDWMVMDELKLTLGARYTWDHKFGSESARVICYYGFCGAFGPAPASRRLLRVDHRYDADRNCRQFGCSVPFTQGVLVPTTYDLNTGFATRFLDEKWGGITGTAGVEWTPDDATMAYAKYSRGYKDGGYYEGANTALVAAPFTEEETVDSVEVGIKRTWGEWLTTNLAAFHYQYKNLQLP
jgi:iron complex outermembrane receptor protein